MKAPHGVPVKASTYGRSNKFAITVAQRQWSKRVRGSNDASLVIGVRLRDKDSPTLSKVFGNSTTFQQKLESSVKKLGAQSPGTLVDTIRNSIRATSRIFFKSNELVKLGTINGPADITTNFLNISQYIFVLVMSRALDAVLENEPPILTQSSS